MSAPDPRFLSWLLASLRSGLLVIDHAAAIVAMNADARRVLLPAGSEADPVGRDCREVLAAEPTLVALLLETLDGVERPSRAELVLEAAEAGPSSTIGFTLTPVRDGSGDVRGAAVVFRDLAPIERLDEQERLRERLAALGEMAAGLAHEIRNPLASMEVLAGLLERQLPDRPGERELVVDLRAELRALTRTVNASLDFVKPSVAAQVPVDVVAIVEDALAVARTRVPFHGTVERSYAATLPALPADPEQLRAVVGNLIVNAFEAMDAATGAGPGRLCLGIQLRGVDGDARLLRVGRQSSAPTGAFQELVISVGDDGPGIPEALRQRIFYPFFTTREAGSGVGLALAQKLVSSHGGALDLETAEGCGATFRIRLPLIEPAS